MCLDFVMNVLGMKRVWSVLQLQLPVCPLGVSRRAHLLYAAQVLDKYWLLAARVSLIDLLEITFLIYTIWLFHSCSQHVLSRAALNIPLHVRLRLE